MYQRTGLSSGVHTIEIRHGGPAGTIIDVDALEVYTPATPVGVGVYDNTNTNWFYTGTWNSQAGLTGPFNGTLATSSDMNASASIEINGTAFRLRYTTNQNRGIFGVYVDGTKVAEIYANTTSLNWQTVYQRTGLSSGVHTIQIRREGGAAGSLIEVDALEVYAPTTPTPLGVGIYDNTHDNWSYSGSWAILTSFTGPYNGTLATSSDASARASIQINGTSFRLRYSRTAYRGIIQLFVDGVKVDDINAYSVSTNWQAVYQRTGLSSGVHTIEIRHGGTAGSIIDVDALEVFSPPTPVGVGVYDNTNTNWVYTGTWSNQSGLTGPFNGTLATSSDPSARASIQINGTAFRLRYTTNQNRGVFGVYVDGTKVAEIYANTSNLSWQTLYQRRGLTTGVHTIEIRREGGAAGSLIEVDALEVYV
ncbi:MAG: hypothetical protein ACK5RS_00180, partial [Acidobacteriota bacterium]